MPSHSAAQHRLIQAALHNPDIAKKRGIPQKVAKEFVEADKGKNFSEKKACYSLLETVARRVVRL